MCLMTLREICNVTKVSRRAIQGYEKAGLVQPVTKNKRGYLLYDKKSISIILEIRFYQDMGYSIKEIKDLSVSSKEVKKESLFKKVEQLKRKKTEIDNIILEALKMIEKL